MQERSLRARILEEAQRVEHDVVYSAKGHYEAATGWNRFHLMVGIPTVVCSAVAGASALAQFPNHTLFAGGLALLVAALTAVSTFLNANRQAAAHQQVGTHYNALRNAIRLFCNVEVPDASDEQALIQQVKTFAKQRDELNVSSPPIPRWAYRQAKREMEQKAKRLSSEQINERVSEARSS